MADTRHLSLEEHGAYFLLLMIAWRTEGCCLPDDDARIARMLGISASRWAKLKPTVMDFWHLENGAWRQGRLTKVRSFVDEKRAKNRRAADKRWHGQVRENSRGSECERTSKRINDCNASQPQTLSINSKASAPLHARDCFNEICIAADWHPTTDDQRLVALAVVEGWLVRGFDLELDILPGIRKARDRRPAERTRSLRRFASTIEGIYRDRSANEDDAGSAVRELTQGVVGRLSVPRGK